MPQMAPMNWLILFMYFMLMLYINLNLMYFNFMKMPINKYYLNKLQIKNYNKFI
uniref:ATP synthase complex subunit 8 n=1 Tax=Eriosoma sp. WL-2013 TaxID=1308600 RepID=A0A096VKC3_9HEMI|nr:ATP synthase F0 subunit 8 [Eriosoma sp. WL-2013]